MERLDHKNVQTVEELEKFNTENIKVSRSMLCVKHAEERRMVDFKKALVRKYVTKTRYPIYVISKGRWETRMTVKELERMQVPHRVVIEPQEQEKYAEAMDPSKLLILPFSNLGQGSIPARNWVWEHSISEGHFRHWIMDDNIRAFWRRNNNMRIRCLGSGIFRAAEDFTDRFENVAQSGLNYYMFVPDRTKVTPFYLNTRVYSCILNRNDLPFRWRGKYNEDTDLSIRCLKAGWCTILFNAFVAQKMTTMKMKGGNTEELYKLDGKVDGRLLMAQSLQEQHPDITTITRKWGRWQHQVYYENFKRLNKLQPKKGLKVKDGWDNYGMELVDIEQNPI